ncbi:MAG: protein MalT [Desulfobacter sp.]|nr:MAG: protein MalT [Desulfobacter sp.]
MAAPCRIVLVTGQAAQGKTTLVADYLAAQEAPSSWFHLNRAASDHGVLFDMLHRGLDREVRASGQAKHPPHITLGSSKDLLRQIETLTTAMGRWEGGTPPGLNLVLDDMESLAPDGSAYEFIEALLRDAPDHVRFFFLSRTIPPLNLSRFKIKKQLITLTNEDLAFTRQEAMAFFRTPIAGEKSSLGGEDIEKILAITEGWAGGLVLVSESMRTDPDLDQLPDRLSSEAFSYFSDEIYRNLAPELRAFLMETSLFDELDTRVLSEFFTDADPCALLEGLERRNLFVRKISPHPRWPVFRYNNLFREFLAADLRATRTGEAICALNEWAGQICWEHRDHDKAVDFFMAAGAHDRVAEIIRIKGTGDLIKGRSELLFEWIQALPAEMTAKDPWLIFFATAARRIKGGKANITAFKQALDLFRDRGDLRGTLLCLAYLIEAAVFIRQPATVILKWIRQGEDALTAMQGKQRYTWARTLLWQQIGLGYITGNGDIPKGISACRNAMLLARGIENRDLLLNASVILTLGFVQSGDFSGAREMLDRISASTGEEPFPEYRALNNITNIDFALKRGELDTAGRLLARAEEDIEKFGLIFLYPGFVEAKAIYHTARGQYDQALQTADHLSDFSILEGNEFYLGVAHRIKAVTWLSQGEYRRAVDAAQAAVRELGRRMRGDIHLNLARQVLGISLFHLGEYGAAVPLLEQVLEYFRGIGSDLSLCETDLVLGLIAVEKGEDGAAWFAEGFEKAVENRYLNFPFLGAGLLGRSLAAAAAAGAVPGGLTAYFNAAKDHSLGGAVKAGITTCLERAGKKEQATLAGRLEPLYRAAQPPVFIRTLGSFRVSLGGRELMPSLFGGAKPLLLLKAMVLKGREEIPKEVLIDSLWPGAAAAAGDKNFKINLHRLRKALEPDPVKNFGYVYIAQKSGRVSLDPDLVRLDTQDFLDAYSQGCRLEAGNEPEKAIDAFDRAWELYGGEYFADDLYLEWVGHHREFYRHKCIEILEKKAALHRQLNQLQAAANTWQAVLTLDCCREEAFRHLMAHYGEAGLKGEVVRLYHQCRAALRSELDAEPDKATLDLLTRYTGGDA